MYLEQMQAIGDKLETIEYNHGVKILYAVEAGSRAWDIASKDSDYDVRFIYRRPLSWYLSVFDRRDVIEPPIDGLLDVSGWDIRKALQLLYKSNPPLLEWLFSPIVYCEEHYIVNRLRALARKYFNPKAAMHHYLHMASGNFLNYLQKDLVNLKKYLYVIRPLRACAYIDATSNIPYVSLPFLLNNEAGKWPEAINEIINNILKQKYEGAELTNKPRIDELNIFLVKEIAKYGIKAGTAPTNHVCVDDLNEFFFWLCEEAK